MGTRQLNANERLQHVTIKWSNDARLYSATYATPLKIYVKDLLVYDSAEHPENDTTLPPI